MPALGCNTKVDNLSIRPLILRELSVDWLLLLSDRYCQGLRAESEEDISIRRTYTVSQQHGAESYAG